MITACLQGLFKKASAVSFILTKTIAEISSGLYFLFSPLYETTIYGFESLPGSTLNGHNFISFYTIGSSNFLPIKRFASKTVLVGFLAT